MKTIADNLLAIIICAGFFFILGYMLYLHQEKEVLLMMLGSLVTNFGTVVQYRYGSSLGSAIKDERASDLAKSTAVAAEVAKAVVTPPERVTPAVSAQIKEEVIAATGVKVS